VAVADASSLVFSNITLEQYAKLTAKAHSAGIEMNGNSGRTSKMGIEVEWNYSDEKQELMLRCLSAPFFMSVNDVNARLKSLVDESLRA
jgi:hypothetical protein